MYELNMRQTLTSYPHLCSQIRATHLALSSAVCQR
jgi:hypothetical protein